MIRDRPAFRRSRACIAYHLGAVSNRCMPLCFGSSDRHFIQFNGLHRVFARLTKYHQHVPLHIRGGNELATKVAHRLQMKFFPRGTALEFKREVAALLGLPPESGDLELRAALETKGLHCVAWYDTRMQAIIASGVEATADASALH